MRRPHGSLVGWLVAVVALLYAGVEWIQAQPALPEGAFVTAADGSRWAVANGARVRLVFQTDDAGVLAGLRDAGTASTLAEAGAALAGQDASSPSPPASTPAATLIGQQVVACAEPGGARFEFTVTNADWQRTLAGVTATGNGMWAVLVMDATNLSSSSSAAFRGATAALRLKDERDREFFTDFFGGRDDLHAAIAPQYGAAATFIAQLQPGITETRVLAFQLPPDVQRLTLHSLASC